MGGIKFFVPRNGFISRRTRVVERGVENAVFPVFLLNSVKLSFPIISAVEDVETNYDTYVWNISSLKFLGPRKFQI